MIYPISFRISSRNETQSDFHTYNLESLNYNLMTRSFGTIIGNKSLFWHLFCKVFSNCKTAHDANFTIKKVGEDCLRVIKQGSPNVEEMIEDFRVQLLVGLTMQKDFEIFMTPELGRFFFSSGTPIDYDQGKNHERSKKYFLPCYMDLLKELQLVAKTEKAEVKFVLHGGPCTDHHAVRIKIKFLITKEMDSKTEKQNLDAAKEKYFEYLRMQKFHIKPEAPLPPKPISGAAETGVNKKRKAEH